MQISKELPKICVLICTYNRLSYLDLLLQNLEPQANAFSCEIIIVDSGTISAEAIVAKHSERLVVNYHQSNARGLSAVRNLALRLALERGAEFVALIDDDEWPSADWLANLLRTAHDSGADIIAGPVNPIYEIDPPWWEVKERFFKRPAVPYSTANLMLRCSCLPAKESEWFQQQFAFCGGEDEEFLTRLAKLGRKAVSTMDAIVNENIPAERLTRRYMQRRGFRDGVVEVQLIKQRISNPISVLFSITTAIGRKLGYALNHVFWSVVRPSRIYSAISDFSAVAGLLTSAMGYKFVFYGQSN